MWKKLDITDLQVILSQDEIDALDTFSLDASKTQVVQDMIDMASDLYRGAFISKSYAVDTREHYTPSNYRHFILVYARWAMWTRFAMSPSIALDEARKEEYKLAVEMLKNPKVGVESPEWEHSSSNPDNPDNAGAQQGGSIGLPFLRFDEQLWHWGLDNKITKCNCS